MAGQIKDGGLAFPIVGTHEQVLETGMTLRDYFAAKAMPLAWRRLQHNYQESADMPKYWLWTDDDFEALAEHSYEMADAMLRARKGGAA